MSSPPATLYPMRALIIDDDPQTHALLRSVLAPLAQVVATLNASSGLEAFRQSLEQNVPFDVVFLDIVLPDLDGHQALLRLRGLEDAFALEDKPTVSIVVSELRDAKNINRAFFVGGAASYLAKPLNANQIRAELAKFGLMASNRF